MKVTKETFPKEWDPMLLSELVEKAEITLDRGEVISSITMASNPGNYPVYSSSAKNNGLMGYWGEYQIDEELITWSVDGGGYLFYRPKHKFSVTNVCGMLRANKDRFNIRYLHYLLEWQHSLMTFDYVDKAHPSVIRKRYLIPTIGKLEQDSIATILSTLDRAIASTEQLIAKHQRIKTGLLHDLLTRGIDEHGNLRNEKTHKFKDSKLGRIPVEWECKRLGEIYTDLKSGSTPLRKNKAYFENGTFLWVKTLDLNEDDIFDTQEKITKRAIEESSCNLFPVNSVLIAMYGGWEQIGRTAVLKKEATTNQAITALFNPRVDIVAEYIQFFLQHFRYKWKSYAVSTRKDPNITKTDIQNYLIAFPKEDAEQQSIVKAIKNSKRTISNYNDYLTKLQSLKAGLMQDLLSGKVRVK